MTYLYGKTGLGNLGKFFCAPNTHKFAEINELAKKVKALNLSADLLASMSPRNQSLTAVLGLWEGGGACCGDCTEGLDADFEFLNSILAKVTAEKEAADAAAAKANAEKEAAAAAASRPSAGSASAASGSAPPDEGVPGASILDEEVIAPPGDNKMFLILGGLGVGLLLLTIVIKKLFSKKKKKKKKVAPELAEDTAEAARRRRRRCRQ